MTPPPPRPSRWSTWLVRVLGPVIPRRLRRDWVREWQAELECREAELLEWGAGPRRAAWRAFRDSTGAVRDALWLQTHRWEDEMTQDIRFGLRLMRRSPWLSATAIVSLAIGIGATTAVFSVINAALLRSLPYPAVDRLVAVTQDRSRYFSPVEYLELEAGRRALDLLSAVETREFVLTADGQPAQIRGQRVSASFAPLVGLNSSVMPVIGRSFNVADFAPEAPRVVLIGHRFWTRRFASDPAVAGRRVMLDAAPVTIAGVLPATFDLFPDSDLLEPLILTPKARNERLYRYLEIYGRLRPDETASQAAAELSGLGSRAPDAGPIDLEFVRELLVKNVRRSLLTMWAMAGLVLLAACLNFANLLTARATARQQELAVRASLGGRRLRLARQLVIEGLVLVAIGGALGLALAQVAAGALVATMSQQFLGAGGVALDARVLGFSLLASLVCGVVFAALPALTVSARAERSGTLLSLGGLRSDPPASRRTHTILASLQIALTLSLLVGAALFVKSFWQLAGVDPGYDARNGVTLQFDLPARDYRDSRSVIRLIGALGQGLRDLPGVRAVGETSNLPLAVNGVEIRAFTVENAPLDVGAPEIAPPGFVPPPPPPPAPSGTINVVPYYQAVHAKVGPGFFGAMGVPLLAGREFTAGDREGTPLVTMVNRAFADRYLAGADPIGRRVRLSPITPWMTVVGVVGNVRRFARDDAHRAEFYRPFLQADAARQPDRAESAAAAADTVTSVMFVLRTPRAPDDVAASARTILARVAPALPIARVDTLQGAIDNTVAQQRVLLRLFVVFAAATLVLAAVGIYGVTTYIVSRRQLELAVRVTLGARPTSITALVVGQGLPVIGLGLLLGLATSMTLSKTVAGYLFRVSPFDPWMYVAVAAILALVVLAASYLPARRAARVDPLVALKRL